MRVLLINKFLFPNGGSDDISLPSKKAQSTNRPRLVAGAKIVIL